MWSARELLKKPPEPKLVVTLYCLATGGLHNINELKGARGMLEFERSVLTFDLLMLLFSDPQHQKIKKKSAQNLCEDYNAAKSNYGHHEIYYIENICTSDGKLREIYTPTNFLNPGKKDVLATRQVTAELHRYHKCFNENVKEETPLHDFETFEGFLRTKVIRVIYEYGYGAYSLVKQKLEESPNQGPNLIAPIPYDSKISDWSIKPVENTGELGISDSIKSFLGQSLFFTYAVPKLLTFLPPGDTLLNSKSNTKTHLMSNLQCVRKHLLNNLPTTEGECQNTEYSGLRTNGSYLYLYMSLFDKGNVNLFTFLYYMLENCEYASTGASKGNPPLNNKETAEHLKNFGFFKDGVDEYINLFVTSFRYYKHSAIFSKDNICCKGISKIEDGHQYLYALVRLIALHREFQKVAFDCPDTGLPAFLKLEQLCYFPESP
eukprot:Nk52_evm3s48 gene=Nk52_evmTU3s48